VIGLLQDVAALPESTRESFRLLDVPALWIVVLVLFPITAVASWIGYWRENIPTYARAGLITLRFLALALLFIVVFRPVLVQRREEVRPAQVLILVDDSASMRRVDAYSADTPGRAELARLAQGALEDRQRSELAAAALEDVLLPELAGADYEPRLFTFASGLAPLASPDALSGHGNSTHLGDGLAQALAAHRGRHVTDVVVISDGRQNGGLPTIEAARAASSAGIPIHTVVVGDTRPERNAIVELVEAPANALAGDEIAVIVRVSGRGTAGDERTLVVLEELEEDGEPLVAAEEEVSLTEAGERVLLVARPGPRDSRPYERRFRVTLPPLEDETLVDDNQLEFSVHVTPEKIRVLYVDGYPRWEYRFLRWLLLRADDNIQAQMFLLSATPDFPQDASTGLPSLAEVPTREEDLLDNYDVIILGDVDPLDIHHDPARGAEFVESLRGFVEAGGGLLLQAGESDNPESFVLSSQLQELIPVKLDPAKSFAFQGDTTREVRPVLEDPLAPHEIVRLHHDLEINRRLWEEPDGLRGFHWYKPIERAKPGAQVLLRHPTASTSGSGERDPLLVVGYFPKGRTMFLAIDSTWRWRFHFGDRYHERFWRNAIRWLSLGRLKSGNRRVQLETPRSNYTLGERVPLEARVLDEDFRPSSKSRQEVRWQGPDERLGSHDLTPEPNRPGLFRGHLDLERPGLYRAWIERDGERLSSAEFEVVLPSRENADPSPDPERLAELSLATGGRAVTLAATAELAAEFPGGEERREPISSKLDDLWDQWGTLVGALALLSAEWILRKRMEMV